MQRYRGGTDRQKGFIPRNAEGRNSRREMEAIGLSLLSFRRKFTVAGLAVLRSILNEITSRQRLRNYAIPMPRSSSERGNFFFLRLVTVDRSKWDDLVLTNSSWSLHLPRSVHTDSRSRMLSILFVRYVDEPLTIHACFENAYAHRCECECVITDPVSNPNLSTISRINLRIINAYRICIFKVARYFAVLGAVLFSKYSPISVSRRWK